MKKLKKKVLYEIRRQADQEDPVFDEVVAHKPGFVHIEQMDKGHWWIGIDVGQGKRIMVNFTARGAIKGTAFLD